MFKKKQKNKKILRPDLGVKREKIKKKKQNKKVKKVILKIFFYIFLLCFIIGIPYFIFFKNYFEIKYIEIEGTSNVDAIQLKQEISDNINGEWLGIISKNNLVFPWNRFLGKSIKNNHPIIKEFKIEKEFPDRMNVFVTEYEPGIIFEKKKGGCVYDKDGESFDYTEDLTYLGKENLPVFSISNEGELKPECESYFSKDFIDFILNFSQKIREDVGIELERFWMTPNLASGDFRVKTKEGWELLLDENLGAEDELEMFKLILENDILAAGRGNLEYVDLRTRNRVYYRFKNQETKTEDEVKNEEEKSE